MVDKNLLKEAQDASKFIQKQVSNNTEALQEQRTMMQDKLEIKQVMSKEEKLDERYPDWKKGPRNFYDNTRNYDTTTNLPSQHQLKTAGEYRKYLRENMVDSNNQYGDKFRESYIDDMAERAMLETHKKEKAEAYSNPVLAKQHQLEKDYFYSSKQTYDQESMKHKVDFDQVTNSYQDYKNEFNKTYRTQPKAMSKTDEIKKKINAIPVPDKNKAFAESIEKQLVNVKNNIKNIRKGQGM